MGLQQLSTCTRCGAPAERTLCWACIGRLSKTLEKLVWLVGELQVDVTRQSRGAPPIRRSGGETPLVFDAGASEAAWVLESTLRAWASELTSWSGYVSPQEIADWLLLHVLDLADLEGAADCLEEMESAVELALSHVDRNPVSLFLEADTASGRCMPRKTKSRSCAPAGL